MSMPDTMNAWVLHGARDLRLDEVPRPAPGPGDVLVRVEAAGVCGSDVHYFQHGHIGRFVPSRPFTLGHEFAGVVAAVGPDDPGAPAPAARAQDPAWPARRPRLGDRVAVDPSRPCDTCATCLSGRYNLCPHMVYFGSAAVTPPRDGCYADFIVARAAQCHVLPDGLDVSTGALLEPLAVAVHAVRRAGPVDGRSVLVSGAGTIGQLALLALRAFGAAHVAVTDPRAFARRFAEDLGAGASYDPLAPGVTTQVSTQGFDVVIEASGTAGGVDLALRSARAGATVVQVGTLVDGISVPGQALVSGELDWRGSWRFAHAFGPALDLVASGRLDPRPIVTGRTSFDDVPSAIEAACSGGSVIKMQIAR